jgi:hypothetical protein
VVVRMIRMTLGAHRGGGGFTAIRCRSDGGRERVAALGEGVCRKSHEHNRADACHGKENDEAPRTRGAIHVVTPRRRE